jgi:hypothetical protein
MVAKGEGGSDDPASEQSGLTSGRLFVLLGNAVAIALALYLIRDIWNPGVPLGSDMGAHFVRAEHAIDHFFSNGRIDGWQDRFGLGYQQSLFLGPGFNVLVWLLTLVSFGSLSTFTAVKAAIVLSYIAMPPAVSVLAWAMGLGRRSIGVAAILSLGVTVTIGGAGLAGISTFALVPNALGAVFTTLGAAGVALLIRQPTLGRVLFTAVCAGLVLVTHPWASIVLVIFTACFGTGVGLDWLIRERRTLGLRRLWRNLRTVLRAAPDEGIALDPEPRWGGLLPGPTRRLRALLLAGGLGAGLAALQIVPLVAHYDLRGDDASFGDDPIIERFATALAGMDYLRPYMMPLILAGLGYTALLAIARRPFALPLLLTPLLYIVVARAAAKLAPSTLTIQLMNRSLFFVGILGVLTAAALIGEIGPGLSALGTAFGRTPSRERAELGVVTTGVLIAVALAVIVVPEPPPNEKAGTVTPTPALQHAADELRRRVPDTGRYVVQTGEMDMARGGIWMPSYWLAWATGRNSLNNYNLESSIVSSPVYEGDVLASRPPDEELDILQRYGVTHMLLFARENVPDLLAHPRVAVVWEEGDLVIAEVRDRDGRVSPVPVVSGEGPTSGRVLRADPQHPKFEVSGSGYRLATLAMAWSPKWRARVNGQPVALGVDDQNLMTVQLPPGTATLELDFGPDLADFTGLAITLAALALAGLLALRWRRPSLRPPLVARLIDRLVGPLDVTPPERAEPDREGGPTDGDGGAPGSPPPSTTNGTPQPERELFPLPRRPPVRV